MGLAEALEKVVRALPAGEHRSGQLEMARAVEVSIRTGKHLLVQAGTGTGKSNAYLIPAILSGKKVVVATATNGVSTMERCRRRSPAAV